MKIRILTSCTGDKRHKPENTLTQADFQNIRVPEAFAAREQQLAAFFAPASEMYTGLQHTRLLEGVKAFRETQGDDPLDLWVLSAGYGLIPGDRQIAPYEITFQGMKLPEIKEWSEHLGIPGAVRQLLAQPADLTLVLLGDDYLKALQLDGSVCFGSPTIFFTSEGAKKQILGYGTFLKIPLTNKDAKRFSCGLVGVKGEVTKRLLKRLTTEGESLLQHLFAPETDLLAMLEIPIEVKTTVKRAAARSNPKVDQVISIPASWWEKPHRGKLRYFIPEWDDMVDPDFDFLSDTHSGGSTDWSNEVYAHQMYPEPNYDGILISKVVAEKTAKKKERINALGVHRFLRVPREFPIMGDCGAFGYIMEEKPPYTTAEILDYYTRLDFDYGVSIDHLIVTATEAQKKERYELTIHNAEEFLKEHRKAGLSWEPIGAVQGWDPKSYAEAARQYVAMGYKYIALGGLVRSSTPDILKVLDAVHPLVPETVNMHLFGLARLKAVHAFASHGVRSVDSASYLRQAWMRDSDGYLAPDGTYAAIRIPEVGKSFRAKVMLQAAGIAVEKAKTLEANALGNIRGYDSGKVSLQSCLDALLEYDSLFRTTKPVHIQGYRRTLADKPWKSCPCEICRNDGVEVIIFRGNNRNRRRGFHNTYVFYRIVQRILNDEQIGLGLDDEEHSSASQLSLFAPEEALV